MATATNNAQKVAVGKPKASGGAYAAPVGTAVPGTLIAVLDPAFVMVGYVSSDGVVQTIKADSKNIVAWGGDTVRKVQTSHDVTYKLTMIETNSNSQTLYYGAAQVTTTAATAIAGEGLAVKITAAELEHHLWAFEIQDGPRTGRVVLPDGQVTSRDDVSFINDDAVSYAVEITAYPDATGVKAYIYWNDGVFATV